MPTTKQSFESSIRGLVERTRAGDQVAMGIIAEVRDKAKQGNKLALRSRNAIADYITKNPPSGHYQTQMGAETETASVKTNINARTALWRHRTTSIKKYGVLVAKATPLLTYWEAVVAVVHGPKIDPVSPLGKTARIKKSRIGEIMRKVFSIRNLQNDNIPIARYCPQTAWELGE